jgi:hypothetical protein
MIDYNLFMHPYLQAIIADSADKRSQCSFLNRELYFVSLVFPFLVSEGSREEANACFQNNKQVLLYTLTDAHELSMKLLGLHHIYTKYYETKKEELFMNYEDIMDKATDLWKMLEECSLKRWNKHKGRALNVFSVSCSYPFGISSYLISELIMDNSCIAHKSSPNSQLYIFTTEFEAEIYQIELNEMYELIATNQYKLKKYWRSK